MADDVRAPTTLTRTATEGTTWGLVSAAVVELMDHYQPGFPALKFLLAAVAAGGLATIFGAIRRAIFALEGHKALKAFFGAETIEQRAAKSADNVLTKIGALFAVLTVIGCAGSSIDSVMNTSDAQVIARGSVRTGMLVLLDERPELAGKVRAVAEGLASAEQPQTPHEVIGGFRAIVTSSELKPTAQSGILTGLDFAELYLGRLVVPGQVGLTLPIIGDIAEGALEAVVIAEASSEP